jgi:hypothetical protein
MRESEVVSFMPSHDMMSRLIMEKSSNALFSSRSVDNYKIKKKNLLCKRQFDILKSALPAMINQRFKINIAWNGNLTFGVSKLALHAREPPNSSLHLRMRVISNN